MRLDDGDRVTNLHILQYAQAIAGGAEALARHLCVTEPTLQTWLTGMVPTPTESALRAIDLIIVATPAQLARSRELLRQRPHPEGEIRARRELLQAAVHDRRVRLTRIFQRTRAAIRSSNRMLEKKAGRSPLLSAPKG